MVRSECKCPCNTSRSRPSQGSARYRLRRLSVAPWCVRSTWRLAHRLHILSRARPPQVQTAVAVNWATR
eukprot:84702-Pyramimonas_sp.AAC.1